MAEAALPWAEYPDGAVQKAFSQQALEKLRSLPGVRAAGAMNYPPLSGRAALGLLRPEGEGRATRYVLP